MSNVDVRAAIDDAIRERSSRALLSQDAVLLGLLEEARHTGDGSSHSARVSAWAHIGKHLGMFVDRVHVMQFCPITALRKAKALNAALKLLCDAQRVRSEVQGRKQMIAVNPDLFR